ncbi:MAG: HlyC/CorC family transporter [Chitinophagaceae bacterium]|nr:HlyC/CorC family transporter [Chitinophagaceae bacterium]
MAFYSANRMSFELKKKQGGRATQIVSKFIDSPAKFLGTTLIGFHICLVFLILQLSTVMRPAWEYIGVQAFSVRLIAEILIATVVVLVFAGFIPRAWFRARSNTWLGRFAAVTDFFYGIFAPVATRLIDLSEWILKFIFDIKLDKTEEPLTSSDLKNLFNQPASDERNERSTQLMENAQELPKVKIRQCLVPRKEIIGVESQTSIEEIKHKFVETKLSKLVVFEKNIDHIIGYIHQLDLFKKPESLQSVLLPIPAVPESMSATDLIGKFTRERKSIAWVVDEFGGTAGVITMEDVLEELFGEIHDEYDTEEFVEKQLAESEYIFSGRLELDYLEEKYGFVFDNEESETLSGYIIHYYETIPQQKERIIIGDYEFDILNVSDTRIETVKMKKLK